MIVVSDSSPLITLARAQQLNLLHEFYGQILIPTEVHEEVVLAGAGLPGAKEVSGADWIQIQPSPLADSSVLTACAGLGNGESSAIYLGLSLKADLVLIDEGRARRAAKKIGLSVAGSIAILERGAQLKKVDDLRSVYRSLLEQGIRFDHKLLEESLRRLNLEAL